MHMNHIILFRKLRASSTFETTGIPNSCNVMIFSNELENVLKLLQTVDNLQNVFQKDIMIADEQSEAPLVD